MKKLLVLSILIAAVSAYPQGQVNFNNRVTTATPPVNAPISYEAAGPMAAVGKVNSATTVVAGSLTYGGANALAALYGGALGSTEAQMVLLIPSIGFKSGAAAGYVSTADPPGTTRTINGILPGAKALVQVRAWDSGDVSDSYEDAAAKISANHGVYLGKSMIMQVTLGGGSPPVTPPNLVDEVSGLPMAAFSMGYFVPEPSIIGLGILGAVAGLFVFRRRN